MNFGNNVFGYNNWLVNKNIMCTWISSWLESYVETILFSFVSDSVTDTNRRLVANSCALSGIRRVKNCSSGVSRSAPGVRMPTGRALVMRAISYENAIHSWQPHYSISFLSWCELTEGCNITSLTSKNCTAKGYSDWKCTTVTSSFC